VALCGLMPSIIDFDLMQRTVFKLRLWLGERHLLPEGRLSRVATFFLLLDIGVFLVQSILNSIKPRWGDPLGGWVKLFTLVATVLFCFVVYRWLKARVLWRLRNRLIVTYVFIGVTPVVLLVALALGSLYLFAGQFATFIVTSEIKSELESLQAGNSAIGHELAARLKSGTSSETAALAGLRSTNHSWANRQVYAWMNGKLILSSAPDGGNFRVPALPSYLKDSVQGITRDGAELSLRAVEQIPVTGGVLVVLSSEPLDQRFMQNVATNLGEVTLYSGLTLSKVDASQRENIGVTVNKAAHDNEGHGSISIRKPEGDYVLDTGKNGPVPTYTAGTVPPKMRALDRQVTFPTTLAVMNWQSGDTSEPVAISVQTRLSKLYDRLFDSLGDFAPTAEVLLVVVAGIFGVIELSALFIGTRLTRTITKAIAHLYDATKHINRGDFRHRIPVKSADQLATLANSFNSMTASLEKLIEEQKEKQRLENELVIAQEVQAQLFPRQISQLASLEVHGFCRPARTVSGDYYDFLTINADKMLLAVGDISGKGISAALLMATIHSAVRAYSLEETTVINEMAAVGASAGDRLMVASRFSGSDDSPSTLLALLNHQLYESTPTEKYATLFLGIYDGLSRKFTYSNGGHLPPIVMSEDGSIRRLDCGGTVVGLFDKMSYEQSSVQLRKGEIFVAYSDGVTEPENDFGEFGESRLIDLLRENRDLPLQRMSEIITAAVDDWIGANEQPDDVTLVLARAR
jgi:sigma-B regulation protein RsbU (phosphoserine phosphatase)